MHFNNILESTLPISNASHSIVNQKYALQGLEIGFVSKNTVMLHVVLLQRSWNLFEYSVFFSIDLILQKDKNNNVQKTENILKEKVGKYNLLHRLPRIEQK